MSVSPEASSASPLDCAIIGVGKSGTSSLFQWLDAHPDIVGTRPKETYYFMDRDHPLAVPESNFNDSGWPGFEAFMDAPQAGRKRLEATVHNIYQDTALKAFSTPALGLLAVVILREPAAQILSAFNFTRNTRATIDPALTFPVYVEYLLAEDMQSLRQFFLTDEAFYILSRMLSYNHYVTWLDQWSARLHSSGLEIVLTEQLRANPREVVMRLCNRLDIDGGFYTDFSLESVNITPPIRSFRLRRIAKAAAPFIPAGRIRAVARNVYGRFQHAPRAKRVANDEMQAVQRLREYFAPWNRRLMQTYDCDWTYWQPRGRPGGIADTNPASGQ